MKTSYTFCLLLVLLFSACDKDFEKINRNPNAPEQVSAQYLLSNILWEAADSHTREGWLAGNMLAQQTANLEFLPVDRYDLGTNTEYWNTLYHLLNDVEEMQAAAPDNKAYQAAGMIMRAWLAAQLTDLWTDVPYSNALKGASEGNFSPTYDRQQDIYLVEGGILDLLRKAVPLLESTSDRLAGDIMYGGELEQWVRFANSLRLRYLLRISKQVAVGEELQALVEEGRLIQSPEGNAAIPYLSSSPNQWFIYTEREGRYTDVRMSSTIDSVLQALDDPRVASLFKPTVHSQNTDTPVYEGIPNGLSRASQNAYDLSHVSLVGARYRDVPNGFDASFMTYRELQFTLAEAAERGMIPGLATTYYEAGIKATFNAYGSEMPEGYLNRAAVTLNETDNLNKILSQKWLALWMQGYEAWFNIRRTGFPALPIPADNLNGNQYPVRYRYPESEQAVNGENYSQAVQQIGEDSYNSKGWWEQG